MDENWRIIEAYIRAVRRRMIFNLLTDRIVLGLCYGTMAGLLLGIISLIVPVYYASYIIVGCIACGAAGGVIYSCCHLPDLKRAALTADASGFGEALVTALELKKREDAFCFMQRKVTAGKVQKESPKTAVKLCFPWKAGLLFIGLCLMCTATTFIPAPARQKAALWQELASWQKDTSKKIDELKSELASARELSDSGKAQLSELLDDSKKQLSTSTIEEASDRQSFEKRLDKKLMNIVKNSDEQQLNTAAAKVAADLGLESSKKHQQLADSLSESLEKLKGQESSAFDHAAEQMASMALSGNVSQEIIDSLSKELGVDSQSLENMVDAATVHLTDGTTSDDNSLDRSEENRGSLENSSSSGQDKRDGHSQSQDGSQEFGSSQDDGIGQNNRGNGSSNNNSSNGLGNSGGGSSGHSNNGSGGGMNYGDKDGILAQAPKSSSENVYVPGNAPIGDDENLSGTRGDGKTYTKQSEQALSWVGEHVDYNQVIGSYTSQAYHQIDQSNYPESMKNIIKDYFMGLNQ